MDVKILKKSDRRIKFILGSIDTGLANALRRIAKNEIPILAIEEVNFEQNSSGLYDELLAHRLGLIPLVFDPKLYRHKDACTCRGGCSRCEVQITLEAEGPTIVRASSMESKDVWPLDGNIPIVELLEGQSLKLQATAVLGYGKDHAKWQAASVGYQNVPIVRVTPEKASTKIVDICPTNVFEKRSGRVRIAREQDCVLCMRCVEISEGVTVKSEEDSFLFDLESVSGLVAPTILNTTLDILEDRAQDFKKQLRKELK